MSREGEAVEGECDIEVDRKREGGEVEFLSANHQAAFNIHKSL